MILFITRVCINYFLPFPSDNPLVISLLHAESMNSFSPASLLENLLMGGLADPGVPPIALEQHMVLCSGAVR